MCFRPFPLPLPFQARRLNRGATISARKVLFGIRWLTIGLIMLGAMVNFLSRQTLSIAAPTVMTSLHITTQQYGWITAAFQGGIMLQPVVGYVIDILGVKSGFALFAFLWSVICMAHGLGRQLADAGRPARALGFAEGAFSPGGLKVVSEWFPARERGLAGGLYNIGPSLGSMLAPPLVAWAILHYYWQASFVIVGLISLVWVALWLLFYRPVRQHPSLVGRRARPYRLSARRHSCKRQQKAVASCPSSKRAQFLGHRTAAFPDRSHLGHAVLLGAALSDHRAPFRPQAYRALCLDAVPGRRSGLRFRAPAWRCSCRSAAWT